MKKKVWGASGNAPQFQINLHGGSVGEHQNVADALT